MLSHFQRVCLIFFSEIFLSVFPLEFKWHKRQRRVVSLLHCLTRQGRPAKDRHGIPGSLHSCPVCQEDCSWRKKSRWCGPRIEVTRLSKSTLARSSIQEIRFHLWFWRLESGKSEKYKPVDTRAQSLASKEAILQFKYRRQKKLEFHHLALGYDHHMINCALNAAWL